MRINQAQQKTIYRCVMRLLRVAAAALVLAAALLQTTAPALPAQAAQELFVPLTAVNRLQASAYAVCAWGADDAQWCWGAQIGNEATPMSEASFPGGALLQVANGYQHRCVVTAGHDVFCQGANTFGQLGIGNTNPQGDAWVQPNGLAGQVKALAVGLRTTCAHMLDNSVRCWGANGVGQVGVLLVSDEVTTPMAVAGVADVLQVAAGHNHFCALQAAGVLDCWGENADGQIGDGTGLNIRSVATPVVNLLDPVGVAAGQSHTCAVNATGAVFCWGRNEFGQLGDGNFPGQLTPVAVLGLGSGVVELKAGSQHTCARKGNGTVFCWGRSDVGQLGSGLSGPGAKANAPMFVLGLPVKTVGLTSAYATTCALMEDGTVRCWGAGGPGSVGDGAGLDRDEAVQVVRELVCYAVTPAFTGQGSLPTIAPAQSPLCPAGHYVPGEWLTIADAPAPGWRIKQWLANDAASGVDMEAFQFTLQVDMVLTAQYEPCHALTLGHMGPGAPLVAAPLSSKGCAAGHYAAGEVISLTAAPEDGSFVSYWVGTNNDGSAANANQLSMPAAQRTVGVAYGGAEQVGLSRLIYLPITSR